MIGALDLPTAGQVIIGGKDISEMNNNQLAELRQQIGFVFQFFNLIPRLTAFHNVELSMTIQGISKSERIRKTEQILQMVGLEDRMHHKPSELSGGEQQRVAIARALAKSPKYLLMDEPTGNVDTKTRDKIMELIIDLNRKYGMTIIIITHDPEIAKRAKRQIHLVDGILEQDLEKSSILNQESISTGDLENPTEILKKEEA
jgi:putative ABC transport system ATP-binding protein